MKKAMVFGAGISGIGAKKLLEHSKLSLKQRKIEQNGRSI